MFFNRIKFVSESFVICLKILKKQGIICDTYVEVNSEKKIF